MKKAVFAAALAGIVLLAGCSGFRRRAIILSWRRTKALRPIILN